MVNGSPGGRGPWCQVDETVRQPAVKHGSLEDRRAGGTRRVKKRSWRCSALSGSCSLFAAWRDDRPWRWGERAATTGLKRRTLRSLQMKLAHQVAAVEGQA